MGKIYVSHFFNYFLKHNIYLRDVLLFLYNFYKFIFTIMSKMTNKLVSKKIVVDP